MRVRAVGVDDPGGLRPAGRPGLEARVEQLLTAARRHRPTDEIVHEKVALPDALVLSFAVTVVEYVPAVVGVPEIRPVDALIDSPAGRPVAL